MRDRASQIRRAPTRRRIVQAVTEVAGERGYPDLSVARVIKRAGVSRSTFYEHFADRDAAFLAALDRLGNDLIERLEAVAPEVPPGPGPLVEALCDCVRDDPGAARVLFMESLAAGDEAIDLRTRLQRRTAVLIADALQGEQPTEHAVPTLLDGLVAGLFRLFAIRLRRGPPAASGRAAAGGLSPSELAAWVDSYTGAFAMPRREPLGRPAQKNTPSKDTYESKPLPAGRHRLTRAQVEMNQQARVCGAIARLSYEAGYEPTSVAKITAEARISRNAFYKHFPNKADAAVTALEMMLEEVIGACASAFTSATFWPEQIWRAAEAFAGFFSTAPDYAYLGLVETHRVGNEMVQLIYGRLGAFALFLEEGYRWRPQARELPRISSEAIGATMYEVAFHALRRGQKPKWHTEPLPQLVYVCLAPFMGHEAAMQFALEKSDGRSGAT